MTRRWTLLTAMAGTAVALGVGLRSSAQPIAPAATLCARFPAAASSMYRPGTPAPHWRTDYPASTGTAVHAWEAIDFKSDWRAYMTAVLSEVQAAGLMIQNNNLAMNNNAQWWIAPWMDYGPFGREARLGLTKERGPDAGDLSPTSQPGAQVWAIGFYNQEGAKALGEIFADPCNPTRPAGGWTFPAKAVSFKLLFTTASPTQVNYLSQSPTVAAFIDPDGSAAGSVSVGDREVQTLRLIQMDIAVRDPRAPQGWVFGTFVWQNNQSGLYGDLTPVGLSWSNDPGASAATLSSFATLPSTRLNEELAGILWQGDTAWPQRPWPGFEGRLNGPADNFRSSCLSCHGLAQWPRSKRLGLLPRPAADYTLQMLSSATRRDQLRTTWMKDVPGGTLMDPSEAATAAGWGGAISLDYSLQLEASFTRMCGACANGALTGPTPAVCKIEGIPSRVTAANCPAPRAALGIQSTGEVEPPRQ